YPDLKDNQLANFWNTRLNFSKEEISWGTGKGLAYIIFLSLHAGVFAKFPSIFHLNEEFFYSRNIGFLIFPMLTAYFAWKNKLSIQKIIFIAVATVAGLIFINALPDKKNSDTIILSCIHLIVILWSVLGFAFVEGSHNRAEKR